MNPSPMPRPGVIRVNGIVYASAYLGIALVTYVVGSWITYFYAPPVDSGLLVRLSPSLVGAAVALGRIVDALLDPPVAAWSDRYSSPSGQAHPLPQTLRPPARTHLRAPLDPARFIAARAAPFSISQFSSAFSLPFTRSMSPRIWPSYPSSPSRQGTHRLVGLAGALQYRRDRRRRAWGRPPHRVDGLCGDGRHLGHHLAGQLSPACLDHPGTKARPGSALASSIRVDQARLGQSGLSPLRRRSVLLLARALRRHGGNPLSGHDRDGRQRSRRHPRPGHLARRRPRQPGPARPPLPDLRAQTYLDVVHGWFAVTLLFWGGIGRLSLPLSPFAQGLLVFALAGVPLAALFVLPNALVAEVTDVDFERTGSRREAIYFGVQGFIVKLAVSLSAVVTTQVIGGAWVQSPGALGSSMAGADFRRVRRRRDLLFSPLSRGD